MFILIVAILLVFLIPINYYFSIKYSFWKNKGVPHLKPRYLFGNYVDFILMRKTEGEVAEEICKKFPDEPVVGAYIGTEPVLLVKDPELIKIVTTKDFYYFNGRNLTEFNNKELFFKNLFNEGGNYWKVIRQNLTPLFSSSKMKMMFQHIDDCNIMLEKLLDEETQNNGVLDIKNLIGRYTMDCLGTCVFGVETKAMGRDIKNNVFRKIATNVLDTSYGRTIKIITRNLWPHIFYGLGFKALPMEIANFFNDLILKMFKERNYQPSKRSDFIDLLLSLKQNEVIVGDAITNMKQNGEKSKISIKVEDDLLIAQSFALFAAGFETTANTLSFTLFELAKNVDAQAKAHEEVDRYVKMNENNLKFECITELPYLEACTEETLRIYPVLGVMTREVMEDYIFPSGLKVEKSMRVHIPLYYLHKNPEHFTDPEVYRPERFLFDEKDKIKPYTHLSFGAGPRICIGLRFAKMVMLSSLVTILKKYRVELADGMPKKIEMEPKFLGSMPKYGVNLNFMSRNV